MNVSEDLTNISCLLSGPNQMGHFSAREKKDILPEHNEGMYTVPQILTNRPEDFIRTAYKLSEYGYQEINLNLGCPSRTVVTKGRGAGFLADPDRLDAFLYEVFEKCGIRISVKTRLGMDDPEEFYHLLEIYNKIPDGGTDHSSACAERFL